MISFAQLWRQYAPSRHKPDDASVWDNRITQSPTRFRPSNYSRAFLDLARLEPGQSVFDMGCGAGTLAIPCAEAGHEVLAADFSDAMLAQLQRNLESYGKDVRQRVTTMNLSWEDDWAARGIEDRSFDVAFASRSIITQDLADSIDKLSRIARQRACVTVTPGTSPRVFPALLKDLGLTYTGHPDASFVFAVATELGYRPQVSYIDSPRQDFFSSFDEAFEKYRPMLAMADQSLQGADLKRAEDDLREWLGVHLVPARLKQPPDDPGHLTAVDTVCVGDTGMLDPKALTTDVDRMIPWAFISWSV